MAFGWIDGGDGLMIGSDPKRLELEAILDNLGVGATSLG